MRVKRVDTAGGPCSTLVLLMRPANDVETFHGLLAGDLNATSTDLRPFAGNGGKLILYAGWADPLIPSQSSITRSRSCEKSGSRNTT